MPRRNRKRAHGLLSEHRCGRLPTVPAKHPFHRLSGALCCVILLGSGCSTPTVTTKPPTVRFIGTESLRTLELGTFLECATPEAQEMFERKLQRSSMSRPLYYTDKANRDQPTSLDIPTVYTLTAETYRRELEQGGAFRPEFILQLRQRQRVLVGKVYELSTAFHDEKDKLVRTEVQKEAFPRFHDWLWHPECRFVKRRPVRFEIRSLQDASGHIAKGSGMMDDFGRITFDLRPYLQTGRESQAGLRFTLVCPGDGLSIDVVVTRDAFLAFP